MEAYVFGRFHRHFSKDSSLPDCYSIGRALGLVGVFPKTAKR
jgi:hypothetical protein